MKVTLAILNRNDRLGAEHVIPKIPRDIFHEIFVVDGCSTDGSQSFFESQGLVVHSVSTGGRGGAMRFAIEKATGDYLVFLSTDGEEDPKDLPHFVEQFSQGADMVIGSRLKKPGGHHKAEEKWTWWHRKAFLQFITAAINLFFGSQLYDCWNGYRGFRIEALKDVKTDAKDFLIEAQQTIRFIKKGYKVVEFPTREGTRIGGASQNPIFKSGFGHLILIVKEKFF